MCTVNGMRAPVYSISHLMNAVRSEMTEGSEKGDNSERDLKITLDDSDLWRRFDKSTNEMIVTKNGRRMFPVLSASISGMNPNFMYSVLLDFAQAVEHRWKFVNGEWTVGGKPESPPPGTAYVHPDSPNFGAHWMKTSVRFSKVKLSNKLSSKGQIMLNSLHKYEPRIHIIRVGGLDKHRLVGSFSFSETKFIAVTAYQNEYVTQLKIKHNPFAKAFLDIKEKREHKDIFEDGHDQTKYPKLGGWFLPGRSTLCAAAAAAAGPSTTHQFASSIGLHSAGSHGCERYSSIRSRRTAPYPPKPHQKYSSPSNGTVYSPDTSSGLSLLSPQNSWNSHATTTSSMSPHGNIPNSCAQYDSAWPATTSSSNFPHGTNASTTAIPTALVRASGGISSPASSVCSPHHYQPPTITESTAMPNINRVSCAGYQDVYHDVHALNGACSDNSVFSSHHMAQTPNHHHSSKTIATSSWKPLTPPLV